MKKLPCFGITAHALQILTNTNTPVEQLDSRWFNWVGAVVTNVTGYVPYAPRRLQIVCADPLSTSSAARWYKNTLDAGYECAFICAANEEPSIDEIKGLPDDLYYSLVYAQEDDREENDELLRELRELDTSLGLNWGRLLMGGGASIDLLGFTEVTPQQWWCYGQAAYEWIQATKGDTGLDVRIATPDYSVWNPWGHIGLPNRVLTLAEHFDTPTTDTWQCNVASPLTKQQIPNLGSDIEAYWPMRQMPFCGVTRTTKGVLKAVGALPDTLDASGNWLWDDGSIRAALLKATAQRVKASAVRKTSGLVEWVIELIETSRPSMAMTAAASTRAAVNPKKETPAREIFIAWKQVEKGGEQAAGIACKLYVHQEQVLLKISSTDASAQEALGLSFVVLTVGSVDQRYSIAPTETPNLWRVKAISATQVSDLALTLARYASNRAKQNTILMESGLKVC